MNFRRENAAESPLDGSGETNHWKSDNPLENTTDMRNSVGKCFWMYSFWITCLWNKQSFYASLCPAKTPLHKQWFLQQQLRCPAKTGYPLSSKTSYPLSIKNLFRCLAKTPLSSKNSSVQTILLQQHKLLSSPLFGVFKIYFPKGKGYYSLEECFFLQTPVSQSTVPCPPS